ncbi:hypothetical protein VN97_g3419, partial [Penicillium thymicola]
MHPGTPESSSLD